MAEKIYDLSVIFKVVDKITAPINKIRRRFTELNRKFREAYPNLTRLARGFKKLAEKIGKAARKMKDLGKSMMLSITTPLTILGILLGRTAVNFETAWIGVEKTVNATVPEFAKLKKELMDLALEIPVATTGLFEIAEAAGQFAIETPNIKDFTKTIADLGVAAPVLEMRHAAETLAQFANVTSMSQKDFRKLASVIVELGNTTATSEDKILELSKRLAPAGQNIGLMQSEIVGFAAALAQLGIRAEAGGTAFSQVMRKINKELPKGEKKAQGFAAVVGLTLEGFKELWKRDPAEGLIRFVEGLDNIERFGKDVTVGQALEDLGMDAARITSTLTSASGSGDKFRKTIKNASVEWKTNTALTIEAEKKYKTTESKLVMFKNRVEQTADAYGKELFPVIRKSIKKLEPILDWLKNLDSETKKIILVIGAGTAAAPGLIMVIGFLGIALKGLATFTFLGSPLMLAITALSIATVLIYKNWKDISQLLKDMWDEPIDVIQDFIRWIDELDNKLSRLSGFDPTRMQIGEETLKEMEQKSFKTPKFLRGLGKGLNELDKKTLSLLRGLVEGIIKIEVTATPGTEAVVKKKTGKSVKLITKGYVGAQ